MSAPLETSWTLDTLIWLPMCVVLVIALVVLSRFLKRASDAQKGDTYGMSTEAKVASYGVLVVAFLIITLTAFGFYPWSAEYHQWRDKGGTVASIDNRLIGTGDGMETKFVVRFTSGGQQYGCDDTRCASVRKGDRLTLSCKRAWQYTGTDGYDCRFVSVEAVR